jgi:hypothetical protein
MFYFVFCTEYYGRERMIFFCLSTILISPYSLKGFTVTVHDMTDIISSTANERRSPHLVLQQHDRHASIA